MKHLYLYLILIALSFNSFAQFAGGSGTQLDPYRVSTADQLSEVRNYLDSYFIQTNNIDLKSYDHDGDGKGWMPIAGAGTGDRFTGHYDGNNFIIYNLYINRPNTNNVGLFGHMGADDDVTDMSIINLGLENVEVYGARGTGALVGRVTANEHTKIEYTFVRTGTITGDGATGCLVGSNNSHQDEANANGHKPQISKSFANVDVYWSENNTGDKFGCLAGCTQKGIIINSYSVGSVNVDNRTAQISSVERVGGLVGCGLQRGEIINSYTASVVNVPTSNPTVTNVGGLVGSADGNTNVSGGYWDEDVTGQSYSPAGTSYTTAEMLDQSNYPTYDFTNIWGIDPAINNGYPYLLDAFNGVLPIELLEFSAKQEKESINISWTTISEINNAEFIIEKSTDGKNFIEIDRIKGAGNSRNLIEYQTKDYNPENGINYYRLTQIDFDGKYETFEIKAIEFNRFNSQISLYPNPSNGKFYISTNALNNAKYNIYNSLGQIVKSGNLSNNETFIDLESQEKGVLYVIINDNSNIQKLRMIVK
ncbi:MAG: hypothetical protein C0596_15275 [Marinilabiliales bacterium]|nr:MAG: hypothetical protein C0596_15275 [Marinilabiliales bacterium]